MEHQKIHRIVGYVVCPIGIYIYLTRTSRNQKGDWLLVTGDWLAITYCFNFYDKYQIIKDKYQMTNNK